MSNQTIRGSSPSPEKRLIDLNEVKRKTALGKSTIYRSMASGTFPKAVKFGITSRWLLSEVETWIDRQVEARDSTKVARISKKT